MRRKASHPRAYLNNSVQYYERYRIEIERVWCVENRSLDALAGQLCDMHHSELLAPGMEGVHLHITT